MSSDKKATKDLMKILADGQEGFEKAAAKLDEGKAPEVASTFRRFGQQRAKFYSELEEMAKDYGDDLEESSSVAAAIHRGWMSVKDTFSGSSPKGVIDAAEQGEDHAVAAYKDALTGDLSADLRSVVERQFVDVKSAHDEVRALKTKFKD